MRVSPRGRTGGGVCWWNYSVRQKNTPIFLSPSFYLSPYRRAENGGAGEDRERMGPMHREHEGRDGEVDKSEFAAERVGTDFSAWAART